MTKLDDLLTVNRQRILKIDSEIDNLSDSIAGTKYPQVREHLEGRLAKAFDEKARLEAENQGYDRELTQLRKEKATLTQDVEQTREIYALLESCQSEKERIDLRFRLRQQIRKMVEWIKIYPLQEPYQEVQETEEPYIYRVMDSKHLDKVRIKFTGNRNLRVLLLKSYIDTEGIKLDIS